MWATYEHNEDDEDNAYHIVPLDDDEMHTLSRSCECRPAAKAVDEISTMIIHNSFDGREGYEQALELLTPPQED
jgi:hypothetical protein